jgi:serine/threonine-protein kinase HipA
MNLTLQLFAAGVWHDAMQLRFPDPARGFLGGCHYGYLDDYLWDNPERMDSPFDRAVSARAPLSLDEVRGKLAPAFLHDIAPAGAARRSLMKRLGGSKPENLAEDIFLLARSTPAPIGHLRIKESLGYFPADRHGGFARQDIIDRETGFIEYAYEMGAAIGGASGAGGAAPKLLMTEDHQGRLHPDAVLEDPHAAFHWFIKFTRNNGNQRDREILVSEFCYYRALQALGIATIDAEGLTLEGDDKPSLWMKRFDRAITAEGVERRAVESVYSLAGITEPGAYMEHNAVIDRLATLWIEAGQKQQVEGLIDDYLRRDLLNKILGNSDNHGRNTSIIRGNASFALAPIYDLAPMVMDDEGITRTTKWARPIEQGGEVNWPLACQSLEKWVRPAEAFERLRTTARELMALPDILAGLPLPQATWNHPGVKLKSLKHYLENGGLL